MKFVKYLIFSLLTVVLYSCNDEVTANIGTKPMALGTINDMVVLADKDIWKGMPGDTFKHYFESAYPIMPNPEPMFDLRYFDIKQLMTEPLRKELRTYVILADLSDLDSPATKMVRKDLGEDRFLKAKENPKYLSTVGKDKWARNQLVFYLMANSQEKLADAIRDKFPAIAERVREHDKNMLGESIYAIANTNVVASTAIKERYGVNINIPGNYKIAIDDPSQNILWLRQDDPESTSNIVIRSFDYTGPDQLSKENVIAMRDSYGKEFISGATEGSYMISNTSDLPVLEYTHDINGMYTEEFRGIWEMTNDFMGGPYVTYAIVDKDKGKLIFIDTFVYAAGKDKRDLVQRLEYIVNDSSKRG